MSISSNSGGLITRGIGPNHRLVTRGMAIRFDFGGITFKRESKEFYLDISLPILKEDYKEIEIYNPIEVKKNEEVYISSSIYKNIEKEINFLINLDHSLLIRTLDAI